MTYASDSDVQARVLETLAGPAAADDVVTYFGLPGATSAPFTGRLFQRIGGRGDDPDVRDEITAADLLAVEALSVSVPPETTFRLLQRELGSQLQELLRAVPVTVRLGTPEAAEHLADGSPADRAWRLLEGEPSVGWVIAGKLLARKRPALIPVYDDVVRCHLGHPEGFWLTLDRVLQEDEVTKALDALRAESGLGPEVSDLRLLDVALWMGHRQDHRSCG